MLVGCIKFRNSKTVAVVVVAAITIVIVVMLIVVLTTITSVVVFFVFVIVIATIDISTVFFFVIVVVIVIVIVIIMIIVMIIMILIMIIIVIITSSSLLLVNVQLTLIAQCLIGQCTFKVFLRMPQLSTWRQFWKTTWPPVRSALPVWGHARAISGKWSGHPPEATSQPYRWTEPVWPEMKCRSMPQWSTTVACFWAQSQATCCAWLNLNPRYSVHDLNCRL